MAYEKNIQRIVEGILARMTGDLDEDRVLFDEVIGKYGKHPEIDAITSRLAKGYARVFIERIKKENGGGQERKKGSRPFPPADTYLTPPSPETDAAQMKYELEHITRNYRKRKFNLVLAMAYNLIEKIETYEGALREKKIETRYYNEPFEEILDAHFCDPRLEIQVTDRPIPRVYFLCGSALIERRQIDEAHEVLERGLVYNPVDFDLVSEYITTVQLTGNLEEFKRLSEEAFRIAFRARDIARCYRNLGFYYIEEKEYRTAVVCYALSNRYHAGSEAAGELEYIASETGGDLKPPTDAEIVTEAETHGIPLVPNESVVTLAAIYARYHQKNQPEKEEYFRNILQNELNKDERSSAFVRRMIDKVSGRDTE